VIGVSELERLIRRMAPKHLEMATQRINVTDVSGELTTALVGDTGRTGLYAFNLAHTDSGELFYGPSGVTSADGFPIQRGVMVEIPVTEEIDVWFVAEPGESGDLAILELR
jgi:hypothetical protein